MAPTESLPERRCRRSDDPLLALGLLLEAARRAHGARTIAVADASGLLIAGAGSAHACEELAAVGAARADASVAASVLPLSLYDADVSSVALRHARVVVCIEAA